MRIGRNRLAQMALNHMEPSARRRRGGRPHEPLLASQPSLDPAGDVALLSFSARPRFTRSGCTPR